MGANDLILQKLSRIQSRKDPKEWRESVILNLDVIAQLGGFSQDPKFWSRFSYLVATSSNIIQKNGQFHIH